MGCSLRQQAQDDLESIWVYSNQEWGAEQADKYIRSLLSRFTWLSENPQLGKQRAEIKPGYYCFPEGMHLIFYKIARDGIEIIGIPHQSMDFITHFDI
ncbi:MAG: type II toxin-antitoxin system RelE/ParE family toxin [Acidiferrobacterales bacterium]